MRGSGPRRIGRPGDREAYADPIRSRGDRLVAMLVDIEASTQAAFDKLVTEADAVVQSKVLLAGARSGTPVGLSSRPAFPAA